MMIVFAVVIALLAALAGVLLATLDRPQAYADRRADRWSLALVIATAVTVVAGAVYAVAA
jgi:uncharacterized membrane protein